MAFYENVFVVRPDLTQAQVESLVSQFSTIISDLGGQVTKNEYCGLRTLAYEIRKNRKGHYVLLNIDAAGTAIHEMERVMRLNEDIIRFLTVKVDTLQAGPSALMQSSRQSSYETGYRGGYRDDRSDSRDDARSDSAVA